MSRKKKKRDNADVVEFMSAHELRNGPTMEREIEMLRAENIRLLGKVNRLQAQIEWLDKVRLEKP